MNCEFCKKIWNSKEEYIKQFTYPYDENVATVLDEERCGKPSLYVPIEDCYYSVSSSLNRYSGSGSMGYTYTSHGVFPKFEYDVIEKYFDYTKLSSSDGGFYVDNMKFDFSSKIAAKGINAYGYNSSEEVSLFWTFFGYIRSNTAIDLTPENNFIEDKVAGKYESILCRNGDITSNSLSSIYLGLSLYKISRLFSLSIGL